MLSPNVFCGHLSGSFGINGSRWLILRGTCFQTSKMFIAILRWWHFLKTKERSPPVHFMPYGFARTTIKATVLAVCFSRELNTSAGGIWFLLKNITSITPYPPPALYSHYQTNNPDQEIAKARISWSNVLKQLLGECSPRMVCRMCALQWNCNPITHFLLLCTSHRVSWKKQFSQGYISFLRVSKR